MALPDGGGSIPSLPSIPCTRHAGFVLWLLGNFPPPPDQVPREGWACPAPTRWQHTVTHTRWVEAVTFVESKMQGTQMVTGNEIFVNDEYFLKHGYLYRGRFLFIMVIPFYSLHLSTFKFSLISRQFLKLTDPLASHLCLCNRLPALATVFSSPG